MTRGTGRARDHEGAVRPNPAESAARDQGTRFRKTLVRVLLVQVATLVILWLLQATYQG